MDDLTQRVYDAVSRLLGIPHSVLRDALPLYGAAPLYADALDLVEFIMEVEDDLGVFIPDAIAESVRTVGDLVDAVRAVTPVPLPGEEALRKFRPDGGTPPGPGIRTTRRERARHVREGRSRRVTETPPAAASLAALPLTGGGARAQ